MEKTIFATPTYDVTFKRLMKNDKTRNSFIRVFTDIPVKNSELLDKNLRDENLSAVQKILTDKKLEAVYKESVWLSEPEGKKIQSHIPESYHFLKEVASQSDALKNYFSVRPRQAYADVLCETDDNRYVIVEAQNYKADFLSERFLAYAARVYGLQLKEKESWGQLKAVYGLVFLGETIEPWDNTEKPLRHYRFLDQFDSRNTLDKIQQVEVNLNTYKKYGLLPERTHASKDEIKEWLEFFSFAKDYDESVLDKIKTPEVKKAYETISWKTFTNEEKQEFDEESAKILGISQLVQEERNLGFKEGKLEEKKQIALEMIKEGESYEKIKKYTQLSEQEIEALKTKK